jgi:hypothetical protein
VKLCLKQLSLVGLTPAETFLPIPFGHLWFGRRDPRLWEHRGGYCGLCLEFDLQNFHRKCRYWALKDE